MDEIFKRNLKLYAINKYGSLKNFAVKMEIAPSTISQYINLKTKPCYDFFVKLVEDGCDLNSLFGKKIEVKQVRNIHIDNSSEELYKTIIEEKEKQIELLKQIAEIRANGSKD